MIPGLGTSVRPPLLDESYVDDVVSVAETDTVRTCHELARRGFCSVASTGTVVSGATSWLAEHDADGLTAVAIAPDLGERYLDTIYQTNWLYGVYGHDVLGTDDLSYRNRSGLNSHVGGQQRRLAMVRSRRDAARPVSPGDLSGVIPRPRAPRRTPDDPRRRSRATATSRCRPGSAGFRAHPGRVRPAATGPGRMNAYSCSPRGRA